MYKLYFWGRWVEENKERTEKYKILRKKLQKNLVD